MRLVPWSRRLIPRRAWSRLRGLPGAPAEGEPSSRAFQLLLLCMALLLVAMVSAAVTMQVAIRGSEVAVPDFKGLSVTEATRRATSLGLHLNVGDRLYSAAVPGHRILRQTPAAGTVVRREWPVGVTESLGPPLAAIPDVVGQPERQAAIALRKLGLNPGPSSFVPEASTSPGTVLAQSPTAGGGAPESPIVSLLVSEALRSPSQDSEQPTFVMPDLTGRPLAEATEAISAAGLKLAPVRYAPSATRSPGVNAASSSSAAKQPGTVIDQSPSAGSRVDAAAPIELTVFP